MAIRDAGDYVAYDGDNNDNFYQVNASSLRKYYLLGNGGDDTLIGGRNHDTLVGGAGRDSLAGGLGNDVYYDYLHPEIDIIVENSNQGIDTVFTDHSYYSLGDNLENLTLMPGFVVNRGGIAGVGNSLDNKIEGNANDNVLLGGFGDDTLIGGAGNDVLIGRNNNSQVDEVDILTGGSGRDEFRLSSVTEVFYDKSGNSDYAVITDFDKNQDIIQLEGRSSFYQLVGGVSTPDGFGTGIFERNSFSSSGDLVALVQGSTDLDLNSSYFEYI